MKKQCNKCKKNKDVSFFAPRLSGGYIAYCDECKREYDREYWAKTKDKQNKARRKRSMAVRARNAEYVWNYLLLNPCIDCGEDDPIVLDFDHFRDKKESISLMVGHCYSLKNIKEEIKKCNIRCANCHRRKTAKDFNWYKNSKIIWNSKNIPKLKD